MDLSLCKKKLKQQLYRSFEELDQDLRLIWKNCRVFNEESSQIVAEANAMQRFQEEFIAKNQVPVKLPRKRKYESQGIEENNSEEEEDEIDFNLLVKLAEKFNQASPKTMKEISRIIESQCPDAFEPFAGSFRINLSLIDANTFGILFAFPLSK